MLSFSQPASAQVCAPAEVQGASGSPIKIGSKGGGVYAYTFCTDDYSVRALYLYAPWSALTPSVIDEMQAARASVGAFDSAFSKVTGRQCVIERDADGVQATVDEAAWDTHSDLCFALRDAMAATWPPVPVWRVAASSGSTRPMYPVVNGVRSTTAVTIPRATVGSQCGCSKATAIGTGAQRYCPVPPAAASLVALCGRAP